MSLKNEIASYRCPVHARYRYFPVFSGISRYFGTHRSPSPVQYVILNMMYTVLRYYGIMCHSNWWCTTPLWGWGGDIAFFLSPTLGTSLSLISPYRGTAQILFALPSGYHQTIFIKMVMSPPHPHRGVAHHQFEWHIRAPKQESP